MSVLIKVKPNEPVKDLDVLMRLVLKFIYVYTNKWDDRNLRADKERMSLDEVKLMEVSIVWWANVELKRIKQKNERKLWLFKATIDQLNLDEQKFVEEKLQIMGWMLQQNELGKFDARKEEFYYKSIDWRKFHRLPEAYTEKDFAEGQEALAEFNRKNPDLAG